MRRDTLMRSWGLLLCHSSTTNTLCFSMIVHGPMSQGSVHNSWKLKMSQFFLGLTCHPLSMFEMLWICVRQCVPVPANIQQLCTAIEEEWDNIPQATINSLIKPMWRRSVALHEASGGHTSYWLVFWYLKKAGACICDQQMHICIPIHVKSID